MGTNECSQPASKSSWDSQDFGDVNMVLKMAHFHKSSRPQCVKQKNSLEAINDIPLLTLLILLVLKHIVSHPLLYYFLKEWTTSKMWLEHTNTIKLTLLMDCEMGTRAILNSISWAGVAFAGLYLCASLCVVNPLKLEHMGAYSAL